MAELTVTIRFSPEERTAPERALAIERAAEQAVRELTGREPVTTMSGDGTTTITTSAQPAQGIQAHVRALHPELDARVPAAELARRHADGHFRHGSTTHHHSADAGPHARPRGWRDGSGVVLIDLRASMRTRKED